MTPATARKVRKVQAPPRSARELADRLRAAGWVVRESRAAYFTKPPRYAYQRRMYRHAPNGLTAGGSVRLLLAPGDWGRTRANRNGPRLGPYLEVRHPDTGALVAAYSGPSPRSRLADLAPLLERGALPRTSAKQAALGSLWAV